MASGRDEWVSMKAYMKREGKKKFKIARDSWLESSSTSIEKITSSKNTENAASTVEPTQGQGFISHANAHFQYDSLPGEGFIRLLAILPDSGDEAIQLQLSTVVMDDSLGSYESLSYVCPSKEDHGLRIRICFFLNSGTSVDDGIIPYLSIKSLQMKAKDPRDKIYAIFGIIKAVQKTRPASDPVHSISIDPDYTNPVVYVYRMLTQQLVETLESLDVLGVCPRSTRRGLPS
ncbi:hypothetical protein INS49_007937 [Diaporthe citri]|uniref:uncharacterized protein n=1 Tax=Diaporthe citri TaxID=83186 RepID=UPI001C80904C|nr:uncharacterized protein INS49_007937 [Diaporthe citri]KAG6362843.1 hypothetical protein INS49_007937 [Diaporthe citri]